MVTTEVGKRAGMKSHYTSRQGQVLAFIHHYTTLHRRPPAEAEIAHFFQVTPPSAHLMVLALERRGFITRTPGEARSIKWRVPPEQLPVLHNALAGQSIGQPATQTQGQTAEHAALLRLGKIQLDNLFAFQDRHHFDDSEFIPLLDTLIESFVRAHMSPQLVNHLRCYACELYHQCCQEAQPESTFQANMDLMFSYLAGSRRTVWPWCR